MSTEASSPAIPTSTTTPITTSSSTTLPSAAMPLASIAATTPVFLCSGQGSQQPGMGISALQIPAVAETFECASDVFGCDMKQLVSNAPAEVLNDTRNAQAAITTLSIALGRALMSAGVQPAAILGFSLGQMSALALSGMVSDTEAFHIVRERAAIMARVAAERPGAMSALLKADYDSVRAVCNGCAQGQVLVPANFNCPGQIVISGEVDAVSRAEESWAAQGKRFSRLATAGAFHSPLMQPAAYEFDSFLSNVTFAEARIPLICNTDARPLSASAARAHLADHLTHPVLFEKSVVYLESLGARTFVEVGFGGVLSGLVRRIDKEATRLCVQDEESFTQCVEAYAGADLNVL